MAERLGRGLQNLLRRFNSAWRLKCRGGGMVYTHGLKPCPERDVGSSPTRDTDNLWVRPVINTGRPVE